MPDINELHKKTISILSEPPNDKSVDVPPEDGLERAGDRDKFTVFNERHLEHALEISADFMKIANETPGEEGLERVLEKAAELAEQEDNEVIKYALQVFITHHPEGSTLPIPSLEERAPQDVVPSQPVLPPGVEVVGGLGAEAVLDYFREDTLVNEHHYRWHVVYPGGGIPDPANPGTRMTKQRQGELFWYMHQQMLARYDTERISHGLSKTAALSDFDAPVEEGYDSNLQNFGNRRPNMVMRGFPGYTMTQHKAFRDKIFKAARDGEFTVGNQTIPINDSSVLGNTVESNIDTISRSEYGSLHNFGHGVLASLSNPGGVMGSTQTAVRDPVFYRWHRLIDDVVYEWQEENLDSYDFTSDAPNISLRKELSGEADPDILLALTKDIPEAAVADDFDGEGYGETNFGGGNWDTPPSAFSQLTDELQTTMKVREFTESDGSMVRKNYLDFEEFCYFLRLENNDSQDRKVTARVFLAAEEFESDRRMWIELDKFPVDLAAGQRKVVYRPARFSSVVRKPAYRPSETRPSPQIGVADQRYCDCGWAYHLLLPRGDAGGMNFKLFVMLTDWAIDTVEDGGNKCGSLSFCGAKDKDYPDERPMGYPFDRPFDNLSIAETIEAQPNMATRGFKIRYIPPN